ncbi:hypothetical protein G6O67_006804 [Ophiocordyceps sinensis]|uniref:Uncharacterized protein n=1 Tax=Ophiocordyceps sinensis TaxID=72228 RepID=A0A8H4PL85_9HYPO|nr:hypothetical protein G6O67_006804 [Ophiocordyceps sinensis]
MTVGITGLSPRAAAARWEGTDKETVHRALLQLVRRQQQEPVTMDELMEILKELHTRGFPLFDNSAASPQGEEDLSARLYAWCRLLLS